MSDGDNDKRACSPGWRRTVDAPLEQGVPPLGDVSANASATPTQSLNTSRDTRDAITLINQRDKKMPAQQICTDLMLNSMVRKEMVYAVPRRARSEDYEVLDEAYPEHQMQKQFRPLSTLKVFEKSVNTVGQTCSCW